MTGRGMAGAVVGLLLSAPACGGRNEAAPAGHDAGAVATGGETGAGPVAGGQAPAVDGGVAASSTPPMSPPARTCPAALPPGATWTDVPPPAGLPSGFFATDAWSAGPDDLFFVGADPADAIGDPSAVRRVLHWSGGCWTIELAVTGSLDAPAQISGTSPNDVWITTGDAIYHRDSTGWSPAAQLNAALAPAPGNLLILEDVQARTPDDVWFTTSGMIVHFLNGQVTTTEIPAPPPADPSVPPIAFAYSAISILDANDVWIGGSAEQNANTMPPAFLFHFDGQTWTVHGPVGPITVNVLWPAGSPDALWVAVPAASSQLFPIVAFANDTVTQTTIANWEAGADLISLWGRAPNDIWAAGKDIAHFDGTSWSQVADAPASVRDNTDATVFDNAVVVGDATTTWLTNAGPVFVRKAASASP